MIRALSTLLISFFLGGSTQLADASTAPPSQITRAEFCEIAEHAKTGPNDTPCRFLPVDLPHSWAPSRDGLSTGLYRIEIARPEPGAYGLILNRLALDGTLRVDGQTIVDDLSSDRPKRWRYWPIMGHFNVDRSDQKTLVIEVVVRAHSELKNGLGGVRVGALPTIEAEYRERLQVEVLLIAALAFAAIFAGVIGLTISDQSNVTSRILNVASWLSIAGGLRCVHNLVVEIPLPVIVWQRIGLWFLALAGALSLQIVVTYLAGERPNRKPIVVGIAIITILLTIPPSLVDPHLISNIIFSTLIVLALILLARLAWRLRIKPDVVGVTIFSIFMIALASGVHDLVVHLSRATLSDQYLQTWTLPAVLAISVAALANRAAHQRDIERQLQQATLRREELLRDLHDRIGSRLVALSFHAQHATQDQALVDEIKSLIHEVRLIHGAVATEATSLEALLADLRHLYSRIGGGRLPIRWEIADLPGPLELAADQAIAVLRIVEEAVANIIKHADAKHIIIRLIGPSAGHVATLDIIDDGAGEFRPGESGGLENMRLRAAQSGLTLELLRLPDGKAARIRFPQRKAAPQNGR